jgi:hypothetical protein
VTDVLIEILEGGMVSIHIGIDCTEAAYHRRSVRTGYKKSQVYNITAYGRKESLFAKGFKCVSGVDVCEMWRCPRGIVIVGAYLNAFARCAEEGATCPGCFWGVEEICTS